MVLLKLFEGSSWWILLLILLVKTIEVTVGTVRIILINKGYRLSATLFSFVEIMLWVFVASSVINDLSTAPIKGVVYSVGFSLGIYLGSIVEGKLAFGKIYAQVITSVEKHQELADALRAEQFGVTITEAKGMTSCKVVLMVYANRKSRDLVMETITKIDPKALIVIQDVNVIKGGYVKKHSKFRQIIK